MNSPATNTLSNPMSSVGPPRRFEATGPVILFGHGRSGTSIIAALMRDHLGVAFGTESQFILSYLDRLHTFGPLEDDTNLNRLIDSLLSERWFRRSHKFRDFSLDRETIFAAVEQRTYAGVLDAIFSLFAGHIGMSRWGDKTPRYIDRLADIDRLFPNAQYVYVVRDGRDVALSLKRIHFGPKNMYTAALDWRDTVRVGDAFAEQLAPERLLSIRYEDFVDDPVSTFVELAGFLTVQENPDALRSELESTLRPKIKSRNSNKWLSELTRNQRLAYERVACSELNHHGYETLVNEPAHAPGMLKHCFWHAMSEIGKWRFADYWKDNFYKAKLRLGRM